MRLLQRQVRRQTGIPPLLTLRLRLVAVTVPLVEAEAAGRLEEALGVRMAADWPPEHWEPHVHAHIVAQLTERPETVGWHRFVVLTGMGPELLVGSLGGFPCAAGDVEIGYSIVASQQRQGLAPEAVRAHTAWLLQQPTVHSVSAQTYLTLPQSIKVMQRSGMLPAGPGDEPETVRYRRWS